MCLEQEHKPRSKNTNPKIKNLKITIFSNPTKSSNPKAPKYQMNKKNTTQPIQTKKNLKLRKTHLKQVEPQISPMCNSTRSRLRSLCFKDLRWRSSLTVLTMLMETLATSISSTTGITGNSTKSDGLKFNQKKKYEEQISKAKLLWDFFLLLLIYIFLHILYICDVIRP